MKKVAILFSAIALSLGQPGSAQDQAPVRSPLADTMGEMFKAEPLTPEQQARLPSAEKVVGQLFPPGTYRKMMDQMMGPMLDGLFGSMTRMPVADLVRLGGADEAALEGMGDAKLGEMMAILDPGFEERTRIAAQATIELMARLMDRIEPSYRAGLTRAVATRFSGEELAELHQLFSTPVGARYASESMMIYADPQVMSAMNEVMPAMAEMVPGLMEEMAAKTAHLPQPRTAADLSDSELAQLAKILGVPPGELKTRAQPD